MKSASIEATFHDNDSNWGLMDWMMHSSGVGRQNEWHSFSGTGARYFKIEQKGIGDRFLSLIDKKVSEHDLVLKLITIENAKTKAPSLLQGTVKSLFAANAVSEKKEEKHCAMRLG